MVFGEDEEEVEVGMFTNGHSLEGASNEIGGEVSEGAKDINDNGPLLDYFKRNELPLDLISKEKDKILQRIKKLEWKGAHLL